MNKQYQITTESFKPLLNMSVGFDRFLEDFMADPIFSAGQAKTFPYFNINKIVKKDSDEAEYEIVLALAGFKEDDIEIQIEDGNLKISGKSEAFGTGNDDEVIEPIHKGIAERSFTKVFKLEQHVEVASASLKDGMLRIRLFREVPEQAKPKLIAINSK